MQQYNQQVTIEEKLITGNNTRNTNYREQYKHTTNRNIQKY